MTLEEQAVRSLSAEEVWDFPADSRLVAIRWDLLEWGVVLDFDVPVSEAGKTEMYRGWLVFDGVSDMTIPIEQSRLPTGCFVSGGLAEAGVGQELREYAMSALFPRFDETGVMEPRPAKDITIKAIRVVGILSVASAIPNANGLSYGARTGLASDECLLGELSRLLEQ